MAWLDLVCCNAFFFPILFLGRISNYFWHFLAMDCLHFNFFYMFFFANTCRSVLTATFSNDSDSLFFSNSECSLSISPFSLSMRSNATMTPCCYVFWPIWVAVSSNPDKKNVEFILSTMQVLTAQAAEKLTR